MAVKLAKAKKSKKFIAVQENDLFDSLAKFKLSKKIAVANSGGPDSLSLTILLQKFAIKNNFQLISLSVDHGLRKSSSAELKWLAGQLKKRKIKYKILKWKGAKPKSNILLHAREKRYELLIKECEKIDAKYLFTGHHFDDQVENILLRLIRGSGIKGLGSLQEKFKFSKSKITIVRPLLQYPKKSLISFLALENQKYILDPANYNNNFDRSRIRKVSHHLIDEGFDNSRFKRTIRNLIDANKSIDYLITTSIKKFLSIDNYGIFSISLNEFKKLPDEIKFRSISKILKLVGNGKYLPRSNKTLNLLEHIKKNKNKKITVAGCTLLIKKNKMIILPETSRNLNEQRIIEKNFIWNEKFRVVMKSNYDNGLVIRYLGCDGKERLPKKYRLELIDHEHFESYLSIWRQKEVVAVPDIGFNDRKVKSIMKYEITDIYELLKTF